LLATSLPAALLAATLLAAVLLAALLTIFLAICRCTSPFWLTIRKTVFLERA